MRPSSSTNSPIPGQPDPGAFRSVKSQPNELVKKMIETEPHLEAPNELDHVLRWMDVDFVKMQRPVSEVAPIDLLYAEAAISIIHPIYAAFDLEPIGYRIPVTKIQCTWMNIWYRDSTGYLLNIDVRKGWVVVQGYRIKVLSITDALA